MISIIAYAVTAIARLVMLARSEARQRQAAQAEHARRMAAAHARLMQVPSFAQLAQEEGVSS